MDDLKVITYQGHSFDQSVEAWYTFLSIGFQQRNNLTNQWAQNETSIPATQQATKRKNTCLQTVLGKFETPENCIWSRAHTTNLFKVKVFYDQEPPSGESTTTECGFKFQLFAVIY